MSKRKRRPSAGEPGRGEPPNKEPASLSTESGRGKSKDIQPARNNQEASIGRAHGKDARIVEQVRQTEQVQGSKDATATDKPFDPKSIGKKAVYRPILMSPYKADWPQTADNIAKALMHTLIDICKMDSVRQSCLQRENAAMPKRSARKTREKSQRRKARLLLGVLQKHNLSIISEAESKGKARAGGLLAMNDDGATEKIQSTPRPIVCGLNSITRHLEASIQRLLGNLQDDRNADMKHTPRLIFVCQHDIEPASVTAHLPMLVATYNAARIILARDEELRNLTLLIRMPINSEQVLADALGLRRCSAVAIDHEALIQTCDGQGGNDTVQSAIRALEEKIRQSGVAPMRLAWLESILASTLKPEANTQNMSIFLEPRVKHVHTSAPADMNGIKMQRKAKRIERKARKKESALQAAALKRSAKLKTGIRERVKALARDKRQQSKPPKSKSSSNRK